MKKSDFLKKLTDNNAQGRIAARGGTYSIALIALTLAILIVVNILASVLPTGLTKYDISASKLYSITSNTKSVVNALEKDVNIYWVVQSGEEDEIISNLLDKYASLSARIHITKKNPDVYPTFTAQYTDESVANNSLIVECDSKFRYIPYTDIYLSDIDLSTYSAVNSFDGEGALTSAIDYVVSDILPRVYYLSGHGEAELPTEFTRQTERENMELAQFSLLNEDAIPEDAAAIFTYAPTSDISTVEKNILADYVQSGGKLMVMAGPTGDDPLTNLCALIADYGVNSVEGMVVESDRAHYAFSTPAILLPDVQSADITDPTIDSNHYIIMPVAQGLSVESTANADVTTLLTTSDTAYSKRDYMTMDSYDKQDGDIDGAFAVAVDINVPDSGEIVWFASANMLDSLYNAFSSGANLDLTMNALSTLVGESEAVAIRTKSLSYDYLTISDASAATLKAVMIGIIPGFVLAAGIYVTVERRRRRDE